MAIKHRNGRWPAAGIILDGIDDRLKLSGFLPLPIAPIHARAAGLLPSAHRDPFDRMLIAQALVEGAVVVSGDPVFRAHAVAVIWDQHDGR
jgi:PIN domain nuclease of toxin-antitoxin system